MSCKRLIATIFTATAVTLLAGCSAASSVPTDPPNYSAPAAAANSEAICETASQLTAQGKPDQALALIADFRKGDPRKATDVDPNSICETERKNALQAETQLANGATVGTTSSTFSAQWNQFVTNWISPFGPPFLVATTVLLVLLLTARLFVYVPWLTPWLPRLRSVRRTLGTIGLVAIVGLSAALPILLATLPVWNAFAWGVTAIIACALLATAMASRLRLFIDVQDTDDKSAAARVVGLVSELGAAPPKGLEIPFGADVTALKDVGLSVPGDNSFINALKWLANSLFTATPWRVAIGTSKDEGGALTVVITRNARAHSAYVISAPKILPVPAALEAGKKTGQNHATAADPDRKAQLQPHLYEFAAAAIVVTLARSNTGFKGLCGATDWRSVGLQYVATARYGNDKSTQRTLLVRAVELDPHNLLAEVALKNILHREAKNPEEIDAYIGWLDSQSDCLIHTWPRRRARAGYQALHRRMQLSSLALTLNRDWDRRENAGDATKERALLLLHELKSTPKRVRSADSLTAQQRLAAVLFYASAWRRAPETSPYRGWYESATQAYSPAVALNAACYYCTRTREHLERGPNSGTPKQRAASTAAIRIVGDRLRVVSLDPQKASAAREDPVLSTFARASWFKTVLGSPND